MRTLDRPTVVTAALRVLDRTGLDGLTLRVLARDLGVQPGTLYWHFANKQELLDHMAASVVEDAVAALRRPRPGQAWDAWLAERARTLRTALLATRDGARLLALSRPVTDRRPQAEEMVAVLVAAGFAPADALRALSALKHYIIGAVQEEQDVIDGRLVLPYEREADPHADYPLLKQAYVKPAARARQTQFEFGLRALLAGMTRHIASAAESG